MGLLSGTRVRRRSVVALEARKQVLSSLHPVVSERSARGRRERVDIINSESVQRADNTILRELNEYIW